MIEARRTSPELSNLLSEVHTHSGYSNTSSEPISTAGIALDSGAGLRRIILGELKTMRMSCSTFSAARQSDPLPKSKADSIGKFGSSDVTSTSANLKAKKIL